MKLHIIIISVLFILITNCSSPKKLACDEAKEDMCAWLTADKPPMEIQPEIGDMITEDSWRAAKSIEERKTLMKLAWKSRKKELASGFAEVEARVMALIDKAAGEAREHPESKFEIFNRVEEEIRSTTFGPATAALPIDEWVEVLKHEMGVE